MTDIFKRPPVSPAMQNRTNARMNPAPYPFSDTDNRLAWELRRNAHKRQGTAQQGIQLERMTHPKASLVPLLAAVLLIWGAVMACLWFLFS